jgi:NADH-quinone oxidoreductase subunit J
MNVPLIVFFALALIAVLGAVSLILQKHPIHSALSLIVVMVALAGLYLLMGAEFVAAVQIIVYGGAIMVLFVFVIMLLNAGVEERTSFSSLAKFAGLPLAIALMGCLAAAVAGSSERVQVAAQSGAPAPTKALSVQLFQEFVYPFELTSFLILIAIIGAMVLAQRDRKESHL